MKKKRLICSICAVFMLAFSLILIPFSKIDKSSAASISPNSFTSQTISTVNGYNPDVNNVVKVTSSIFSFYTANTDSFSLSAVMSGLAYRNGGVAVGDYLDYLGPINIRKVYPDNTTITGGYNFPSISSSDSGTLLRYLFNLELSTSSTTTSFDFALRLLYLQAPNTTQCFNSDVVSIEYGGVCRTSTYPNGAIGGDYSFEFPYSLISEGDYSPLLNNSYNWIRFYDSLGNSVTFFIMFYCTNDMALLPVSYRHETVYYNELTNNQIYTEGYNAGYGVGSTEGYDTGYNNGYGEGFDNGENTGYGNGYIAGLETADNTTFLSLIGATIDAPIKAFRGLFNFELLGVNMISLITGLFTLCVIVAIVKICLGGK